MSAKKPVIVVVSGGFDPIHVGHVRLFEQAKALGDRLIVILNNDNWLKKKKGQVFMKQDERKEIIEAFRAVDGVVVSEHEENPADMSVSAKLAELHPDIFANGGDRNEKDAANPASSLYKDIEVCKKLGIKMVFAVGQGGKVQSSSWLLKEYLDRASGTGGKQ
jgi:cytidyltransferase-like protein